MMEINKPLEISPGTGRIVARPSLAISEKELLKTSRANLEQESKFVSYASYFFEQKEREGAWLLYNWCRFCDDVIKQSETDESSVKKLIWLENQTRVAIHTNENLVHPAFEGLRQLNRNYQLPSELALDFIEGMRMNVENFCPHTLEDFRRYCYHVGGVVGLMMCYVMGLTDEKAFPHAVAFGNALKITNIMRDIETDWKNERILIPIEWLREMEIDADNFDQFRTSWPRLARRLEREADARYAYARKGFSYLPWRWRTACRILEGLQQEVGHQVVNQGVHAWDTPAYVPLWKKIWIGFGILISV